MTEIFTTSIAYDRFDSILKLIRTTENLAIEDMLCKFYSIFHVKEWNQARAQEDYFISILFGMLDYCIEEELYLEANVLHKMLINKVREDYYIEYDEEDPFNLFDLDDDDF